MYERFLYLDTDIIIRKDLKPIFNLIKEDVIYALEEGDILKDQNEYYGKALFGDEIYRYEDKTGFSSGVLLFNNCTAVKDLFIIIKQDMVKRKHHLFFYDQPFIIYNAKKYQLIDNKTLKPFAVSNEMNIFTDKTIIHFFVAVFQQTMIKLLICQIF